MGSFDTSFNLMPDDGGSLNDGSYSSAFQAESILPVQFFGERRGGARIEPVKRLMSAVLEDAVGCFERNLRARSASRRRRFLEAEHWLFKGSESTGLFSFESVCGVLDIDPDRLRRALSQWRETAMAAQAPAKLLNGRRCHRTRSRTSPLPITSGR